VDFDGQGGAELDEAAPRDGDGADGQSAVAGGLGVDAAGVAAGAKVEVGPGAREDDAEVACGFVACGGGGEGAVEEVAVVVDGGGDVEGGLFAAFDLEGGDAGGKEVGEGGAGGEVLHGEEEAGGGAGRRGVGVVGGEGVAAGVGAGAAVAGAGAEEGGVEAEAGVGVAEGAVDEAFGLGGKGGGDGAELVDGQFAGEGDAPEAEAGGGAGAFEVVERHLRGGVQAQAREEAPCDGGDAEVLDDDGVDVAALAEGERADEGFQFVVAEEGVEGDVDAAGAGQGMGVGDDLLELLGRKVDGLGARGELRQAGVDGVGAVVEGGEGGIVFAGGGEQFGAFFRGDGGLGHGGSAEVVEIPAGGGEEAFGDAVGGGVAEEGARLGDVGDGMGDVADALGAVVGLDVGDGRVEAGEEVAQAGEELGEGGRGAAGDVVDLVGGGPGRQGGALVGLDDVLDVGVVAGEGAVAVDGGRDVADEGLGEERDDRGVGAVRVLARTEDVEVAQADGGQAVERREVLREELVDVLGDGVGRKRGADVVLDLRERLGIAVGGGGGRVDDVLDAGLVRGVEDVDRARDVDVGGQRRVVDGQRHRAERGVVQDVAGAGDRLLAGVHRADVVLDEGEARVAQERRDVFALAGGKVVEDDDVVVLREEPLDQVGADESGAAGDQDAGVGKDGGGGAHDVRHHTPAEAEWGAVFAGKPRFCEFGLASGRGMW